MHNLLMDGIDYNKIIEDIEKELKELSDEIENLSDKSQVTYYLSTKISEKRKQLDEINGFLKARNEQ